MYLAPPSTRKMPTDERLMELVKAKVVVVVISPR